MQNISSQFKYTIDLGVNATKTTFKLKKTKKDKITHILLIVFMFIMAGVLIWDILRDASFVIDLIILIALVGMEIFNLIMPLIIIHTQKKFLNKLNLEEIDYTETLINKDKCTETYYKDNKIVMQNVCDMTKLVGYEIKQNYLFIVFNNFACAIFDINTLNIPLEEFTQVLDTKLVKNKVTKCNKL
ncbi:MAG: hypothetical protein J6Q15_02875 [Clostridia bacterium]|nr:hypothetical protein [Clostridia bacterium]